METFWSLQIYILNEQNSVKTACLFSEGSVAEGGTHLAVMVFPQPGRRLRSLSEAEKTGN